jgi:O-antigen/teichoic acid export membrane protein
LIIGVLYGRTSDMAASVTLFRVFLLAFPLTYLYLMNGHVLYAAARQRRVTVVMIGVTVANAVCNAVVIPFWSYWGAVGVSLASECLLFVMLQREVNRLFRAWQLRSAA